MMAMSDESRLSKKIRKLLALAENPAATPAEAAAFTEKAMLLMAKHGIDEALVAADGTPGRVVNRRLAMTAPYARDKASLAAGLAQVMRCRAILLTAGREIVVQVFGFDSDVKSVETLLKSLLIQGAHELAQTPVPTDEHAGAFRRSWWIGFANAVHHRLAQAARAAEAEAEAAHQQRDSDSAAGSSVAVVLAHQAEEIDDELARIYPELRQARRRRLSGGGHAVGYQAGQRVDLGLSATIAAR